MDGLSVYVCCPAASLGAPSCGSPPSLPPSHARRLTQAADTITPLARARRFFQEALVATDDELPQPQMTAATRQYGRGGRGEQGERGN